MGGRTFIDMWQAYPLARLEDEHDDRHAAGFIDVVVDEPGASGEFAIRWYDFDRYDRSTSNPRRPAPKISSFGDSWTALAVVLPLLTPLGERPTMEQVKEALTAAGFTDLTEARRSGPSPCPACHHWTLGLGPDEPEQRPDYDPAPLRPGERRVMGEHGDTFDRMTPDAVEGKGWAEKRDEQLARMQAWKTGAMSHANTFIGLTGDRAQELAMCAVADAAEVQKHAMAAMAFGFLAALEHPHGR